MKTLKEGELYYNLILSHSLYSHNIMYTLLFPPN